MVMKKSAMNRCFSVMLSLILIVGCLKRQCKDTNFQRVVQFEKIKQPTMPVALFGLLEEIAQTLENSFFLFLSRLDVLAVS